MSFNIENPTQSFNKDDKILIDGKIPGTIIGRFEDKYVVNIQPDGIWGKYNFNHQPVYISWVIVDPSNLRRYV